MKKLHALAIFCTLFIAYSAPTLAQKFDKLDVSPMDCASYPSDYKNSLKEMKIIYSRPQLNGRELGTLAVNGKVWRTGANEACELTLYKDMKLGDSLIPAGVYTFYTIPGESEWTAIISKDLNVWGAYFYNEANDVARITVPVTQSDESLEAFSIALDGGMDAINMHLGWGNVRVMVPFTKM
ncbi:MAG TPA: DUF2911 domain-containing protein [Flavobacteriaceae bacterium]|nr:DUF2911 domain-containing protein [Flavobacteriaceae bacterium]MCB9212981.1 DUF2911 domain-containing protein [Alteromonas sp.]HPF11347.1 DUF2911 domain-containing protein [Flavobacteriaceae bacterium]HQU20510.1 DUF2911 domain-containing protein [Flavobacteriaceae bacterium]HQU65857.1 DUF2911 domain-containing protein [Flavobacteriaceae bacterium]